MPKIKRDRADALFSLWVRNRAGWRCERCGRQFTPPTSGLHASHYFGRGKENTRFEPMNLSAHCYGCHAFLTAHPAEHYAWKLKQIGQDNMDKLTLASNLYRKKDRKAEAHYWAQRLKDDFNITA